MPVDCDECAHGDITSLRKYTLFSQWIIRVTFKVIKNAKAMSETSSNFGQTLLGGLWEETEGVPQGKLGHGSTNPVGCAAFAVRPNKYASSLPPGHTHGHTQGHTQTHAHRHTHTHTNTHTHKHTQTQTNTHTRTHKHKRFEHA